MPVDPHDRDAVFEANLRGLFERAYERVQPDAGFRRELGVRVVTHAMSRYGSKVERRSPQTSWSRPLVAAAALLAVSLFTWWMVRGIDSEPEDRANGDTAIAENAAQHSNLLQGVGASPRDAERGAAIGRDDLGSALAQPADSDESDASERRAVDVESADGENAQHDSQADGEPAPDGAAKLAQGTLLVELSAASGSLPETFELVLLRQVALPQIPLPEFRRLDCKSGAHEIGELRAGDYEVFVLTEGFAAWRREDVQLDPGATLRLDVQLVAGVTLRGRVLEVARSEPDSTLIAPTTGAPIKGAVVVSESDVPLSTVPPGSEMSERFGTPFAVTDANGEFTLSGVAPGSTLLRATASGFGPAWIELDAESTGAEESSGAVETASATVLQLAPEARVRGRATWPDGAPRAGAWVLISFNAVDSQPNFYASDSTDIDGRFEISGLPDGTCVALLFAEPESGAPPESFRALSLSTGAEVVVDFSSPIATASVYGRITDGDVAAPAGQVVFAYPANGEAGPVFDSQWRAGVCDAEGRYRIEDLQPGPNVLFAGVSGTDGIVKLGRIVAEAGREHEFDGLLPPTDVRLRLEFEGEQQSIAHAHLLDRRNVVSGGRIVAVGTATPTQGYAIQGAPAGRYELLVLPADSTLACVVVDDFEVGEEPSEVTLEAQRGGSVEVSAHDSAGAVQATLELVDPGGHVVALSWDPLTTDSTGRLEIDRLSEGSWRVRATAPGRVTLERDVYITPGARAELEFQFEQR